MKTQTYLWWVMVTDMIIKCFVMTHFEWGLTSSESSGPCESSWLICNESWWLTWSLDSLQVSLHDSLMWVMKTQTYCDESWWLTWSLKCFVMTHFEWGLTSSESSRLTWILMTHSKWVMKTHTYCNESWWLTWSFKCFVYTDKPVTHQSWVRVTHVKWVINTCI